MKKNLIIIGVVVVLIIAAIVGYVTISSGKRDKVVEDYLEYESVEYDDEYVKPVEEIDLDLDKFMDLQDKVISQ